MDVNAGFDRYAADYDAALHRGVSLSGERKEFFAEARVAWLWRRAHRIIGDVQILMDYGCGTGSSVPILRDRFQPHSLLGIDVSATSLGIASHDHGGPTTRFVRPKDYAPRSQVQLVFSNGTFHHIPVAERPGVVQYLSRALVPGGVLAIWENNPWNPGTRMVMRRIPFDRDAVKVSAPALRRLLRGQGFEILHTDFLFIFPHALKALRGVEPWLVRLPLGAQYLVVARKPLEASGPERKSA